MNIAAPQILILFLVMGGVIAYLGDWLGRKMGKKRLRIMKLRPRHTATFFTVVMGALIPLVTTWGIITVSKEVRAWFTQGPQLVKERDQLSKQIDAFKGTLERQRGEFERSQADVRRVKNELSAAVSATKMAVRDKALVENELKTARSDLLKAAKRETQINRRVKELQSRESNLNQSVIEKSQQLAEQLKQLRKSQSEVGRLRTDTEALYQNSVKLTQQIMDLERQAADVRRAKERAEADKARADAEAQRSYDTLLRLRRELMDLQGLAEGIEAIRRSDVVFRKGEELARLTLAGGLDANTSREQLGQLVKAADVSARERGVKPDSQGRAAALSDRKRLLPDGSYVTITTEDQLRAFIYEIGRTKEDLVIIASSFYNFFSGEQRFVPLEVNMFLNRVVYKSGEQIAATTVDGRLTEDEILDAVIGFLRTKVRGAAEAAGMIPVGGSDGSLGEITFEQMSDVVRRIRERGVKTSLTAVAAKNTKSAESLLLKFKVGA